jgi:hypothetical protein
LIRRVRERYCNQSVVTSDLCKVRLQGMSRVPPGVTDYFGRVVRNQLVRRNARALGGGKDASPLPSGTLHDSSGNRGGAGGGYLIPLHTALGHVSGRFWRRWLHIPTELCELVQSSDHCEYIAKNSSNSRVHAGNLTVQYGTGTCFTCTRSL